MDNSLSRIFEAQDSYGAYESALQEMKGGQKRSHWIWFIFPQLKGFGRSWNSEYYGLDGVEEAKAYLSHPVLGKRLGEITAVLLAHTDEDVRTLMGSISMLSSCGHACPFLMPYRQMMCSQK